MKIPQKVKGAPLGVSQRELQKGQSGIFRLSKKYIFHVIFNKKRHFELHI